MAVWLVNDPKVQSLPLLFNSPSGLPASFHGMVHGIAIAKDFQSAVRAGILAAGDNCSHGGFIGACMCGGKVLLRSCSEAKCLVNFTCSHSYARFGLDSIPEDWVMKVRQAEEILGYIETVVQ